MKEFELLKEAGKKISLKRMRTWRWSTSVSSVPKSSIMSMAPIQKPRLGDLALVQVVSLGLHKSIEQATGNRLEIFPGTIFVGAFCSRYAMDEFEGLIPESITENQECDLLNVGGTLGQVVSVHSFKGEPTRVRILSFLTDNLSRTANTLNYSKGSDSRVPDTNKKDKTKLIVVTGTSMNSGKSNTAKAIIYALTSAGETVVAGKVTGTSAKKDALLMKSAGAVEICDFVDFGYPSTYMISSEEVTDLFWKAFNFLISKVEKATYIVIEIADGLYQRETEFLLNNQDIRNYASHYVFSCNDSVGAIAGAKIMEENFNIKVSAISGPSANSELGIREVAKHLKEVPVFNNMVVDVPSIANIFLSDKPRSVNALKRTEGDVSVLPESIVAE